MRARRSFKVGLSPGSGARRTLEAPSAHPASLISGCDALPHAACRMPATESPGPDLRRATQVAQPLRCQPRSSPEPGSLLLERPWCKSTRRRLDPSCMQPSASPRAPGDQQPAQFRCVGPGGISLFIILSGLFSSVWCERATLSLCLCRSESICGSFRLVFVLFQVEFLRCLAGHGGERTPTPK